MFLRVFTGSPASQSPNPLGCLIKIQIPRPHCVTSWIRSLGMEPRTLHSDLSPGNSDPQQSYRSTCNWGAGRGGRRERNLEGSCHKWSEVRGREREVPGHRKVLTTSSLPSSFSHEPLQPGLTPPSGVGCREKLPEQGKCVLLLTVGLLGLPCRRIGVRGNRSKEAVGAWTDHPDPPGESG